MTGRQGRDSPRVTADTAPDRQAVASSPSPSAAPTRHKYNAKKASVSERVPEHISRDRDSDTAHQARSRGDTYDRSSAHRPALTAVALFFDVGTRAAMPMQRRSRPHHTHGLTTHPRGLTAARARHDGVHTSAAHTRTTHTHARTHTQHTTRHDVVEFWLPPPPPSSGPPRTHSLCTACADPLIDPLFSP